MCLYQEIWELMFSVFWSPEVFLSQSVPQSGDPGLGSVGSISQEMKKHLGTTSEIPGIRLQSLPSCFCPHPAPCLFPSHQSPEG